MTSVRRLITHSGSFHADDVFSFAILSKLFPGAELLRTRNEAVFASATDADIIFDVGMIYDPSARRYDHHMKDKPTRDGLHPYSAVGMVWKAHGLDYLRKSVDADDDTLARVWSYIDRTLIFPIDCADNGFRPADGPLDSGPLSLPLQIENFNPVFDETSPDYDADFRRAAVFASTILENKIAHTAAFYRYRQVVEQAVETATDPRILVLDEAGPWERHLVEMGVSDALYAIYPSHDGGWSSSAVKVDPDSDTYENRKDFPVAWAGLRDEALAQATGVPDAVFCHAALFFCVARSLGGIKAMVKQAVDYDPAPVPAF